MVKSLMTEIAKLLGVELMEIFKVKNPEGKIYETLYKITPQALYAKKPDENAMWLADDLTLRILLNGTETVVKLPENEREYVK